MLARGPPASTAGLQGCPVRRTGRDARPRLVHGLEIERLTTGRHVATADDLAKVPGRIAAILVELPLRDAGCLLPTWDELDGLVAAAHDRDPRTSWTRPGAGAGGWAAPRTG